MAMAIAAVMFGIGALLIIVGLLVFLTGLGNPPTPPAGPPPIEGAAARKHSGPVSKLIDVLKENVKVVTDNESTWSQKRFAGGIALMILGVLVFVLGVVPLVVGIVGGSDINGLTNKFEEVLDKINKVA